jgi:hypothetical protein
METIDAYLERKHEELRLLNNCLKTPLPLARPESVTEVIKQKFRFTAALRAEQALHDWTLTETSWSQAKHPATGSFEFRYDYQRADLEVDGPSFYQLDDESTHETVYTACGMAAISALLFATAHAMGRADIMVLPSTYGETIELIESQARHLRLIKLNCPLEEPFAKTDSPRILLLDSCTPAKTFDTILHCNSSALDLLIFDTTCFSSGSGRIRRVLRWAFKSGTPVVMVRSHNKLDSFGAEYGRLGSAVFLHWGKDNPCTGQSRFKELPAEMRNAIRLFGGAALPAHFPPYVGSSSYRTLTNRRVAAILRNGRRASRYFAASLQGLEAELHFAHGLYVTLGTMQSLDEAAARRAAAEMSDDLSRGGLPIRHAGSFGFDFAATEWFHDPSTDRYCVRVAVPDLPTALWDDLTRAVAEWWVTHQYRSVAA